VRPSLPICSEKRENAVMPDVIPHSAANRQSPERKYRLDPDRAAMIRTAPPVVMDLKEASAYLVCSPRKLRDLVAVGRVKHARVGAKIVIRREWLGVFLGR
jgi:excisionase family DNA binding protein